MAKTAKIIVNGNEITVVLDREGADYISLTDIAKGNESEDIIRNWMRNKNTLEFLGVWEMLNNPEFKGVEFDRFLAEAGFNRFNMTPRKWIDSTNAIGIISRSGRTGGTFAHKDIAFHFCMWISPTFQLYLLKEFQRLKAEESKMLEWSAKRELTKLNYHIHTDAIKENLIPAEVTTYQASIIYANEADVLNVALFGMTAKEWRDAHPDLKGNLRDYASINQLICLANMENLNAVFIQDGMEQRERLIKLNQIAIQQMLVLENNNTNRKFLK